MSSIKNENKSVIDSYNRFFANSSRKMSVEDYFNYKNISNDLLFDVEKDVAFLESKFKNLDQLIMYKPRLDNNIINLYVDHIFPKECYDPDNAVLKLLLFCYNESFIKLFKIYEHEIHDEVFDKILKVSSCILDDNLFLEVYSHISKNVILKNKCLEYLALSEREYILPKICLEYKLNILDNRNAICCILKSCNVVLNQWLNRIGMNIYLIQNDDDYFDSFIESNNLIFDIFWKDNIIYFEKFSKKFNLLKLIESGNLKYLKIIFNSDHFSRGNINRHNYELYFEAIENKHYSIFIFLISYFRMKHKDFLDIEGWIIKKCLGTCRNIFLDFLVEFGFNLKKQGTIVYSSYLYAVEHHDIYFQKVLENYL